MKKAYIKYQNFGKNVRGKFNIFSDRGSGVPNELSSSDLMRGSVINVHDDATKIHIIPKLYNFVASGNSQISGIKFYLTNPSGIYNSENDQYYMHRTSFPEFSGNPNYVLSQTFTTSQLHVQGNIETNSDGSYSELAIPYSGAIIGGYGYVDIYSARQYTPSNTGPYLFSKRITGFGIGGQTFGSRIQLPLPYTNLVFIGNLSNQIFAYRKSFYDASSSLIQTINFASGSSTYTLDTNSSGNILIVGTPSNWIGGYGAGLVNIYTGNPGASYQTTGLLSPWALQQQLTGTPFTSPEINSFGQKIALNESGNILAVGAKYYTYIYTGSNRDRWNQTDQIYNVGNLKFNKFNDLVINKDIYTGVRGKYSLQYTLNTDGPYQEINFIDFNADASIIAAKVGGYTPFMEYLTILTGSRQSGWAQKYRHSKNFPIIPIGGYNDIKNMSLTSDGLKLIVNILSGNNNHILIYDNKPAEASLASGWGISKFEDNNYPRQFLTTGAGEESLNGVFVRAGMLNGKPMYSGLTTQYNALLRYGLSDYEKTLPQNVLYTLSVTGNWFLKVSGSPYTVPNINGSRFGSITTGIRGSGIYNIINNNPAYQNGFFNPYFDPYVLWRVTTGTRSSWVITTIQNTGNLTSARFINSNTGISAYGLYSGINGWSGQFNLINDSGQFWYATGGPIAVDPKKWYLGLITQYDWSGNLITVNGVPSWEGGDPEAVPQYDLYGDIDVNNIATGQWETPGPSGPTPPPPQFYPIYSDAYSKNITGKYLTNGVILTGDAIISSIPPKLFIYNTPGITGFAGSYTSGTFMIGGIPRVGFQNDRNSNYYVIKNNLPSVWRAIEYPLGYLPASMTWYSAKNKLGVDEDPGPFPPTTGWELGDNSIMYPILVGSNALPLPEMNFGTCPGNTLVYPDYVFQAFSTTPEIHKLQFYSGGYINNDGTSSLFPENTSIKDIFPDIEYSFFHKNYYYSNFKNNGRYYLFCVLDNSYSNKWLLAKYPRNFTNGYYYWRSEYSYINYTGEDTLSTARKVYYPVGNSADNRNTVTIDVNRKYINNTLYVQNIDISNYSGFIHLQNIPINKFISTDNVFQQRVGGYNTFFRQTITGVPQMVSGVSGIPTSPSVRVYQWSGLSNPNYVVLNQGSPIDITISGRISGSFIRNDIIQWFANTLPVGGYSTVGGYWSSFNLTLSGTNINTGRFNLRSSGVTNFVQKFTGYLPYFDNVLLLSGATSGFGVRSLSITLSGAYGSYSGITRYKINELESFDGLYEFKVGNSGKYSGLRYFQNQNYILANPLFKITGARCFDSGTNIWSILDTGYNYTNWKNCESRPSQFPSQFWVSGSGGFNESIDFRVIPLYSYNVNYATGLYLTYNTGYNYSNVSGIYNLSKNQIFSFTGNKPMSGVVIHSTGDFIYGCLLDSNGQELPSNTFSASIINNVSTISIKDMNNNIYYKITQSGNNTLYTTSYYSRTFWICK